MKSSIGFITTALLLVSGNNFAQDKASDMRQLIALTLVNLQYTTADELEAFCTHLDPAYSPRFAVKRVEWDKDIKRMYAMSSAMFKLAGTPKTPSSDATGTGSTANPFTDREKMAELAKELTKISNPDYEIPAEWKKMKLGKNIKQDVQISMSGFDEVEQKRRCDFVLAQKGMPALPPKELP